jgi:transporter family-2 protein
MQAILGLFAAATGVVLTLQLGAYAAAGKSLGARGAELAAFLNFASGTLALAAYLLVTRFEWPARQAFAAVPWWAWSGGLLGVFYVVTATVVGPRLGVGVFFALVVLGQLLSALLVDHFGWLGLAQHSISMGRIAGAALLLAGVVLISR